MQIIPRLKNNKIDSRSLAFVVILIYISFINIFVFNTTPEIIVLQFAVCIIIFKKSRTKEFTKFWVPFLALFLLYEFIRGFVDNISPFYEITLFWAYDFEKLIFGQIPTHFFQQLIGENTSIINISLFFYSIFFYYSFAVAFILWLKNKDLFKSYALGFLLLTFSSLCIFFLLPTAPPWMVSELKNLEISRFLYTDSFSFGKLTFFYYFIYNNATAAFPSLHAAWPAYTTLFLIINFRNKLQYLLLLIPLLISFSVIITGEHFIVDVIAGWIFALIAILISNKIKFTDRKT